MEIFDTSLRGKIPGPIVSINIMFGYFDKIPKILVLCFLLSSIQFNTESAVGLCVGLGLNLEEGVCVCYVKANAVGEFQGTAAGDEEHM